MFEELKKKSFKRIMTSTIIILVIAIALIGFFAKDTISYFKGPVKFETLKNSEIKNQYVEAEVWLSLGCFAEEYSKNTKTNAVKTNWLYYAMQTEDEDALAYIGIRVTPSEETKMNAVVSKSIDIIYNDVWPDDYGYAITFKGTITEMEKKELEYYTSFFKNDVGFTDEQIASICLPYYIKVGFVGKFPVYVVLGAEILGLLLLVYGVLRLATVRSGKYQKRMIKSLKNDGEATLDTAERDYESAMQLANDVRLGKIYTFFWNKSHSCALKNKDMVWAYMRTTTHKTNGVKTGTTYEIYIYDHNKKLYVTRAGSEASAISVLEAFTNAIPNVVTGYSDELNSMFRNRYDEFLSIRYSAARDAREEQQEYFDREQEENGLGQTAAADDPFEALLSQSKDYNKKD